MFPSKVALALRLTWSWPIMILLLGAALLPVYAPLMPSIDGIIRPVTTKITLIDPQPDPADPGNMLFKFSYTKLWPCIYVSTEAKVNGIHVDFENTEAANTTRIPGPQVSQVWRLHSTDIKNLSIYFVHSCSPLWETITKVYP